VDRQSRYAIIVKVHTKQADHVHHQIKQRLKEVDADCRHSITFDNGTEFARCQRLEPHLGIKLSGLIHHASPFSMCGQGDGGAAGGRGLWAQRPLSPGRVFRVPQGGADGARGHSRRTSLDQACRGGGIQARG
jgi:hypothetical protein